MEWVFFSVHLTTFGFYLTGRPGFPDKKKPKAFGKYPKKYGDRVFEFLQDTFWFFSIFLDPLQYIIYI